MTHDFFNINQAKFTSQDCKNSIQEVGGLNRAQNITNVLQPSESKSSTKTIKSTHKKNKINDEAMNEVSKQFKKNVSLNSSDAKTDGSSSDDDTEIIIKKSKKSEKSKKQEYLTTNSYVHAQPIYQQPSIPSSINMFMHSPLHSLQSQHPQQHLFEQSVHQLKMAYQSLGYAIQALENIKLASSDQQSTKPFDPRQPIMATLVDTSRYDKILKK